MIEKVAQILESACSPIVAWSGGRDSMLLLNLARQVKPDIPVLWLKHNVSKSWRHWCESIIMEWDLTVFSYPASDTYVVPNGNGLTLIDEYSFGPDMMPVLTDVSAGVDCAVKASHATVASFAYPWTETLTGYRDTDYHTVLDRHYFPPDGTQFGNTRLYAPIRQLTDDDVARLGAHLPQPPSDDTLPLCTNCLQGRGSVWCPDAGTYINSINWSPAESLAAFRQRFTTQGRGLSPQ